jgi:hypothetical protein
MLLALRLLACQIGNKKKPTTVADRGFLLVPAAGIELAT